MVDMATRCMMGKTLKEMGFGSGLWILGKRPATDGGESPCHLSEVADQFGLAEEGKVKANAVGYIISEQEFVTGVPKLPEPILYAI